MVFATTAPARAAAAVRTAGDFAVGPCTVVVGGAAAVGVRSVGNSSARAGVGRVGYLLTSQALECCRSPPDALLDILPVLRMFGHCAPISHR